VKLLAWGRLLRLSLAPSAVADIAAGLCLGAWGVLPARRECLLLVAASFSVYHGGMALNDWADRATDARTRPDRPIPSGAVPARSALAVGVLLLVVGPLLAWQAARTAGLALAAVAACAALYDLAGRGPWRGPLLLALCRGGNLASGLLLAQMLAGAAPQGAPRLVWEAAALYALYVFSASRLGRLEDDEDRRPLGRRPSLYLMLCGGCLLMVPGLLVCFDAPPEPTSQDAAIAVAGSPGILVCILAGALWAAWGLVRPALRSRWSRQEVGHMTGAALRRLLVFTAGCAAVSAVPTDETAVGIDGFNGVQVALAILLGYPLSFALRKVFPPT